MNTLYESDINKVIRYLNRIHGNKTALILERQSFDYDSEYYVALAERYKAAKYSYELGMNTRTMFNQLWNRNFIKNLKKYASNVGVKALYNSHKDEPCIIISAGSSINKQLQYLSDNKSILSNACVIAVNTVLQPLAKYGIKPDYVVAVDAQEILYKYFQYVDTKGITLICDPSVNAKIVRSFDNVYFTNSNSPVGVELSDICGDKGSLDVAGSVATACFDIAIKLGCSPIAFVGQDLAYSDNQLHTRGTYFEEKYIYDAHRYNTTAHMLSKYFMKSGLMPHEGYNGGIVHTDSKFMTYKHWFEAHFKLYHSKDSGDNSEADNGYKRPKREIKTWVSRNPDKVATAILQHYINPDTENVVLMGLYGRLKYLKRACERDYPHVQIHSIERPAHIPSQKHMYTDILYKPHQKIYNCTEGGVKMKYIEQIPLKCYVERYIKPYNPRLNRKVVQTSEKKVRNDWNAILQRVADLKTQLIQIKKDIKNRRNPKYCSILFIDVFKFSVAFLERGVIAEIDNLLHILRL